MKRHAWLVLSFPLFFAPASLAEEKRITAVQAAQIAEGLAIGSQLKMAVTQYWAEMGELPASNDELGLGSPASFAQGAVQAVEVEEGIVVITYGPASGVAGGEVRLEPEVGRNRLAWSCWTREYANLSRFAPQCRSGGAPAARQRGD